MYFVSYFVTVHFGIDATAKWTPITLSVSTSSLAAVLVTAKVLTCLCALRKLSK